MSDHSYFSRTPTKVIRHLLLCSTFDVITTNCNYYLRISLWSPEKCTTLPNAETPFLIIVYTIKNGFSYICIKQTFYQKIYKSFTASIHTCSAICFALGRTNSLQKLWNINPSFSTNSGPMTFPIESIQLK